MRFCVLLPLGPFVQSSMDGVHPQTRLHPLRIAEVPLFFLWGDKHALFLEDFYDIFIKFDLIIYL